VSPSQTDLNDGVNDTLEPVETRFHTLKVKGALVLPVRDAESGRTELKILLEHYLTGFARPLSFLPELSLQWYKTWLKESAKNGDEAGCAKAREKVVAELNSDRNYGAQDEAYRFLFADDFEDEDFWLDFADKARRLGPILICSAGK
ncbi:MAG: hypothetical protein KAG92_11435, partial [Deltaproteobacteria bacterium]|nr:hypothetical protein [Deltaproteobacteria bacterium]